MTEADAARRLKQAASADEALRGELAAAGELFAAGYHPLMADLHRANAARLREVCATLGGWPTAARVGAEASRAAWLIAQHAIGEPAFQRSCAALLAAAAARGEGDPAEAAFLEDRIAVMEGRPQRFGTQFDWDEAGGLSPCPVADPTDVDARRRAVGLAPLAERTTEMRAQALAEGRRAPEDPTAYRASYEAWLREVGWRS